MTPRNKPKDRRPAVITGQKVNRQPGDTDKVLRRQMTFAEQRLWNAVRANRLNGLQFRRQQVLGDFIADFYCNDLNLVIEIDGGIHQGQRGYDCQRDQVLYQRGFKVLRFSNEEVVRSLDGVLEQIAKVSRAVAR